MRKSILLPMGILFLAGVAMAANAESGELNKADIQTYLEKKVVQDPGSCLVEDLKLDIIGIADLSPGQQAEAFYSFEYALRCNRSRDTKSGKGVLTAVKLRDGTWMDRETLVPISK